MREEVLDALGQPRLRGVVQRREAEVVPRAHLHPGPTPPAPLLLSPRRYCAAAARCARNPLQFQRPPPTAHSSGCVDSLSLTW